MFFLAKTPLAQAHDVIFLQDIKKWQRYRYFCCAKAAV
jgi:hypothetical protein